MASSLHNFQRGQHWIFLKRFLKFYSFQLPRHLNKLLPPDDPKILCANHAENIRGLAAGKIFIAMCAQDVIMFKHISVYTYLYYVVLNILEVHVNET